MTANTFSKHPASQVFVDCLHPRIPVEQTVQGERWRISLITDSLIRLEWSDHGVFEDLPTQVVLNRDFHTDIHMKCLEIGGGVRIETSAFVLNYNGEPFSKEGLSMTVKGIPGSQFNTWHYGDVSSGNLKGTARTLDEADGAIPLEDGVISRDGWSILDDTASSVIKKMGTVNGQDNPFGTWVVPRVLDPSRKDIYIFAYGLRFIEAISDFYRLCGAVPLLPRWALGNWWSRFYPYSQNEYLRLMQRFEEERIPFTVSVLDMDWHRTDIDPVYGSGWTGYSWNRRLFPDPPELLRQLHERGLHVTLNDHPRDGVRAFEDEYPQMAKDMGMDPDMECPVDFDPSSPRFMDAYFDMHHRLAKDGVDFWWIDWQQGGVSRQRGLDPLWMLNHMHYLDSSDSKQPDAWPIAFSRYAGAGSHRYPIGFSGDTIMSWNSLNFQPRFTSTASNIGYGWWSHDIGGHMLGVRDNELAARWYQFGTFSPINRLHSSSSPFSGKEPWNFPEPERKIMVESLRLRHSLLPYLYSMNYRASDAGLPLVEPVYWHNPNKDGAYRYPNEYYFGTELIVSPITTKKDFQSMSACADTWLPEGDWFDFFDGRRYRSPHSEGRHFSVWRGVERIPVFAKAGGIVPLQVLDDNGTANSTQNPESVDLLIFPGSNGDFILIEDNGRWESAQRGESAQTRIEFIWKDRGALVRIHKVHGDASAVPAKRNWNIKLRGISCLDMRKSGVSSARFQAYLGEEEHNPPEKDIRYDSQSLTLSITFEAVPVTEDFEVRIDGVRISEPPIVEDCKKILMDAQIPNIAKDLAFATVCREGKDSICAFRTNDKPLSLSKKVTDSCLPESVIAALEEVLYR